MFWCLRMTKDEADGFAYEQMGSDFESLADRRKSRVRLASATVNKEIASVKTEITTNFSEIFDAVVLGHKDDLEALNIGDKWKIELAKMGLGLSYEHILGWMTIKDNTPVFILRAHDPKIERLGRFLERAVEFMQREEIAA